MAIAAGMEGDALLAAGVALVQVSAEGGGAALQDVAHHLFLRGRRRVLAAILLAVRAENVGELAGRPVVGRWGGRLLAAGSSVVQPRTLASGAPSKSSGLRMRPRCSRVTWV